MGKLKDLVKATMVAGVLMIGVYVTVPTVRESVNEGAFNLVDRLSKIDRIRAVSNISYDQRSQTLSFVPGEEIEREDFKGYDIIIKNLNSGEYHRLSGIYDQQNIALELPRGTVTGDTISITILAQGEFPKYFDSAPTTLEFKALPEEEAIYISVYDKLLSYIKESLEIDYRVDVNNIRINYWGYFAGNLNAIGIYHDDYSNKDKVFNARFTTTGYNLNDVHDLEEWISKYSGGRSSVVDSLDLLNQDYTNQLKKDGVFSEYINNGYSISADYQYMRVIKLNENTAQLHIYGVYTLTKNGVETKLYNDADIIQQYNPAYKNSDYLNDYMNGVFSFIEKSSYPERIENITQIHQMIDYVEENQTQTTLTDFSR